MLCQRCGLCCYTMGVAIMYEVRDRGLMGVWKRDYEACPHLSFDGVTARCAVHDRPEYKWTRTSPRSEVDLAWLGRRCWSKGASTRSTPRPAKWPWSCRSWVRGPSPKSDLPPSPTVDLRHLLVEPFLALLAATAWLDPEGRREGGHDIPKPDILPAIQREGVPRSEV
jgi:hypothetical protein